MNKLLQSVIISLVLGTDVVRAELAVTMSPVEFTGQKAVVPLAFKNNFAERVESARAAVFLTDDQGKMVGQSTKWVIGGSEDKPGLAAGATNSFHFVITGEKPFTTTNLNARISFSRVVLEGGKVADPNNDVRIQK